MAASAAIDATGPLFTDLRVSEHALYRRLQLEISNEQIEFVLSDHQSRRTAEECILEEISRARPLTEGGRRLLVHPGREARISAGNGNVRRVNTDSDYYWCDRVCYVVAEGEVRTTIHVTQPQWNTLQHAEGCADNDHAHNLSVLRQLKLAPHRDLPVWLFAPAIRLTVAVVGEWDDTPSKQLINWLKLQDRRVAGVQTLAATSMVTKRIMGLLAQKTEYLVQGLPSVPEMAHDEEALAANMGTLDAWWEDLRQAVATCHGQLLILMTPNEVERFVALFLGRERARRAAPLIRPGCSVSFEAQERVRRTKLRIESEGDDARSSQKTSLDRFKVKWGRYDS